jgi:hypothetical protein
MAPWLAQRPHLGKRHSHDFSHIAGEGASLLSHTLKVLAAIRKTQQLTTASAMRWLLERLLERWVGISFRTFVNGLVPANPNNVYYNDRCAFC